MFKMSDGLIGAMNNLSLFVHTLPSDHPYRVTEEVKKHKMSEYSVESIFERLTLALKVYDDDGIKRDDIFDLLVFYHKFFGDLIGQPEPMDCD